MSQKPPSWIVQGEEKRGAIHKLWGLPNSASHYLDLLSAVLGLALFPSDTDQTPKSAELSDLPCSGYAP
jgi:hypothetical protein